MLSFITEFPVKHIEDKDEFIKSFTEIVFEWLKIIITYMDGSWYTGGSGTTSWMMMAVFGVRKVLRQDNSSPEMPGLSASGQS